MQLCFGLFPLMGKWAFEGFDPRAVAAWRVGAGTVAFFALAFAVHGRQVIPQRSDLWRLLACSILGVALNQVLYLEGLQRSTSINSGLLMLLIPVFTFVIAVAVRQEKFSALRGLGILVAFVGTSQLVLKKAPDDTRPHLIGNLMIAANTLSYSIYLVASRPLTRRYPPLVLMTWIYALSAWTAPFYAWDANLLPANAGSKAWIALGLILIFPTVVGYLLNMYALARVAASTTAVYVFVQPLIAATAGVILLGESLNGDTMLAAIAIFIGIWLVVRGPRR